MENNEVDKTFADFAFVSNDQPTVGKMLTEIGDDIKTLEDLFRDIPENLRYRPGNHKMPSPHSELEAYQKLWRLSRKNVCCDSADVFIGGGVYNHYVPSSVMEIANRAEFRTSYTPYAPELSQGLLTTLYEYQSMVAELTGLELTNTSMYDWATALAEAALMTMRVSRKKKPVFLVPSMIHKDRLDTLRTYATPLGLTIQTINYTAEGVLDLADLKEKLTKDVAGVYVENPNFFGLVEQHIREMADLTHAQKALLVVGVDPISLGVLESPGAMGADICVGEAHHLGSPPSFGGPLLGIFTARNTKENVRNMPGRIIGYTRTKDDTRDAYVMTLQTREQHIRREKATSNICSNQALVSVAAATYLALMGPKGLEDLAKQCMGRAAYMSQALRDKNLAITVPFGGPFFKEFLVTLPTGHHPKLKDYLLTRHNIIIGPNIGPQFPSLEADAFVVSVTEKHSKEVIDNMLEGIEQFTKEEMH